MTKPNREWLKGLKPGDRVALASGGKIWDEGTIHRIGYPGAPKLMRVDFDRCGSRSFRSNNGRSSCSKSPYHIAPPKSGK